MPLKAAADHEQVAKRIANDRFTREKEMKQQAFTDFEYANRKKSSRRDNLLMKLDRLVPWTSWISIIEGLDQRSTRGRKPVPIETLLRMYFLQKWFSMSDEGIEDMIYDSYSMRTFMKINYFEEQVPGATTLRRFRHLMEKSGLGDSFDRDLDVMLKEQDLILRPGTVINPVLAKRPKGNQ